MDDYNDNLVFKWQVIKSDSVNAVGNQDLMRSIHRPSEVDAFIHQYPPQIQRTVDGTPVRG